MSSLPVSVPGGEQVSQDSMSVTGVRPVRTCIGCRARCARGDLLRVVAVDGVVCPDPQMRLGGRGAWLHPECLAAAQRRRAFARALRQSGPLDVRPLEEWVNGTG